MAITYHNENISYRFRHKRLMNKVIRKIFTDHGFGIGEVGIVFCSDEYLLGINVEYLKHDYFTDIITFEYSEDMIRSGDLFISIERTEENAVKNAVSHWTETARIIIHGILHLAGYKDENPKQRSEMSKKEDLYLDILDQYRLNRQIESDVTDQFDYEGKVKFNE
jgi:probable rRNA maturation factor